MKLFDTSKVDNLINNQIICLVVFFMGKSRSIANKGKENHNKGIDIQKITSYNIMASNILHILSITVEFKRKHYFDSFNAKCS